MVTEVTYQNGEVNATHWQMQRVYDKTAHLPARNEYKWHAAKYIAWLAQTGHFARTKLLIPTLPHKAKETNYP